MTLCHNCRRPIGATTYVIQGYLGTYMECEWCFAGVERAPEPELITDTFTFEQPTSYSHGPGSLDSIIDKLTGTRQP